jgi:hypothetical protein
MFISELPGEPVKFAPSPFIPGLVLCTFKIASDTSSLRLMRSNDFGENWETVLPEQIISNSPPVWHTTSSWGAYISFFHSTDYGVTWNRKSKKQISACSFDIPQQIFSTSDLGLFSSTDGLKSWWPLLNRKVNYLSLNKFNYNQILTGYINDHEEPLLFYSNSSGQNFSEWSEGLPKDTIKDFSIVSEWFFLAIAGKNLFSYDERPADIDNSGRVDGGDLVILSLSFGASASDERYDMRADLNKDNLVDGTDLVILSSVWGHYFNFKGTFPNPWDQN